MKIKSRQKPIPLLLKLILLIFGAFGTWFFIKLSIVTIDEPTNVNVFMTGIIFIFTITGLYGVLISSNAYEINNGLITVKHLFGTLEGYSGTVKSYKESTFTNTQGNYNALIVELDNEKICCLTEYDLANYHELIVSIISLNAERNETLKYKAIGTFEILLIGLTAIWLAFGLFAELE